MYLKKPFGAPQRKNSSYTSKFCPEIISRSRMVSRLTQAMMKVIQADLLCERGLRNVIDGEVELIFGFEFHIRGKLGSSLLAPFTTNIERVAGTLDISDFA